jgi:hypothetical protein
MEHVGKKYIVKRNGYRIDEVEYTEEGAKKEIQRWKEILKKYPDGSVFSIEEA